MTSRELERPTDAVGFRLDLFRFLGSVYNNRGQLGTRTGQVDDPGTQERKI